MSSGCPAAIADINFYFLFWLVFLGSPLHLMTDVLVRSRPAMLPFAWFRKWDRCGRDLRGQSLFFLQRLLAKPQKWVTCSKTFSHSVGDNRSKPAAKKFPVLGTDDDLLSSLCWGVLSRMNVLGHVIQNSGSVDVDFWKNWLKMWKCFWANSEKLTTLRGGEVQAFFIPACDIVYCWPAHGQVAFTKSRCRVVDSMQKKLLISCVRLLAELGESVEVLSRRKKKPRNDFKAKWVVGLYVGRSILTNGTNSSFETTHLHHSWLASALVMNSKKGAQFILVLASASVRETWARNIAVHSPSIQSQHIVLASAFAGLLAWPCSFHLCSSSAFLASATSLFIPMAKQRAFVRSCCDLIVRLHHQLFGNGNEAKTERFITDCNMAKASDFCEQQMDKQTESSDVIQLGRTINPPPKKQL